MLFRAMPGVLSCFELSTKWSLFSIPIYRFYVGELSSIRALPSGLLGNYDACIDLVSGVIGYIGVVSHTAQLLTEFLKLSEVIFSY